MRGYISLVRLLAHYITKGNIYYIYALKNIVTEGTRIDPILSKSGKRKIDLYYDVRDECYKWAGKDSLLQLRVDKLFLRPFKRFEW